MKERFSKSCWSGSVGKERTLKVKPSAQGAQTPWCWRTAPLIREGGRLLGEPSFPRRCVHSAPLLLKVPPPTAWLSHPHDWSITDRKNFSQRVGAVDTVESIVSWENRNTFLSSGIQKVPKRWKCALPLSQLQKRSSLGDVVLFLYGSVPICFTF